MVTVTNPTIWMLWLQGWDEAPAIVRACLESWRRRNPDWRVEALDARSLTDLVLPDDRGMLARADLPPQKISNLARLSLLVRHGGVWADATLFCLQPLDAWLPAHHTMGFTAFRDPALDRLMANWFIAAEPGNPILGALHDAYVSFIARHEFPNQRKRETIAEIERLGAALNADVESTLGWFEPGLIERLGAHPYYVFHYIFNRLILTDARLRALWAAAPALDIGRSGRLRKNAPDLARADHALDALAREGTPVQKLDWRDDAASPYWAHVLARLAA